MKSSSVKATLKMSVKKQRRNLIQNKIADTSVDVARLGRVDRYRMGVMYSSENARRLVGRKVTAGYVNQEQLLKEYQFKGFEYGNWTTQQDRASFLSAASQSYKDLSRLLGFKNIGLNRTVGVAFGARGMGGAAMAHFESNTFMINLTKTKGYGAFAHEYGHALDFFFGMYVDQDKASGFLTYGQSVVRRIDLTRFKVGSLRYLANGLINSIIETADGQTSSYYKKLKERFGDKPYWFRRNELFARSFEQYVQVVLKEKGIVNRYLTSFKYRNDAYLSPAEFKRVRPKMKALLEAIRVTVNK